MIAGIDPGLDGALALFDARGNPLDVRDMPTIKVRVNGTIRPRMDIPGLRALLREWAPAHVIVEEIRARKGDGPRAGDLREAYGNVCAAVVCLDIPISYADPVVWRRTSGVNVPGGTYEDRKAASLKVARDLFPTWCHMLTGKGHSDRAEAMLIARYGIMALRLVELARAA